MSSPPLKDSTKILGLGPLKPIETKPLVQEHKIEHPAPIAVAAPVVTQNPANLQSSLQNLIVAQNKNLRILMSE